MEYLKDLDKLDELVENVLDQVEHIAGVRLIDYEEDGIYLTVHAPKGEGKPITYEEVMAELAERNIAADQDLITQIVNQQLGQPVKIAEAQPEVVTDGEIKINLGKDKLVAYIVVYPPQGGGREVSFEDAMRALTEAGVTYGINEGEVREALDMNQVSEMVMVAKGTPPQNGKDAEIEYQFATEGIDVKPTELEDGRVDFYNLNLIQNVATGEVLAIKKPPTPGVDGRTVTNEVILAKPGKDRPIKAGKNTELIDNDTTLIAAASGHVLFNDGKVGVFPVYEVKGDVDFNSGNIDFVGSVIVKGSIREGFIVKADGDVEVNGSISGGSVVCGGHLKVKNGINANKDKGQIQVQGNIFVKFIENARVNAAGDISVGEAIMHSFVSAKGSIKVGGKKGVIVGGIIRAGQDITAKIVGSNFATATELEAGVNPELRAEYNQAVAELNQADDNLDKTQKALQLLKHMEKTQGLPADKKVMLVKLSRSQFQLMASIQSQKDRVQELTTELEETETGKISIGGRIHSGVKISIGSSVMHIQDDLQFVSFVRENGDIKTAPFK